MKYNKDVMSYRSFAQSVLRCLHLAILRLLGYLAIVSCTTTCGLHSPLDVRNTSSTSATTGEIETEPAQTAPATSASSNTSQTTPVVSQPKAKPDVGFAMRWGQDHNLCAATTSATPVVGDTLILQPCQNVLNQQFVFTRGHVATGDGQLCVQYSADGNVQTPATLAACSGVGNTATWFVSNEVLNANNYCSASKDYYHLGFTPQKTGVLMSTLVGQAPASPNMQIHLDGSLFGSRGFTISNTVYFATLCLAANGNQIVGQACDANQVEQQWNYNYGVFYQPGKCLTCLPDGTVTLVACASPQDQSSSTKPWYLGPLSDLSNYGCPSGATMSLNANGATMSMYYSGFWSLGFIP